MDLGNGGLCDDFFSNALALFHHTFEHKKRNRKLEMDAAGSSPSHRNGNASLFPDFGIGKACGLCVGLILYMFFDCFKTLFTDNVFHTAGIGGSSFMVYAQTL